MAHAVSAAAQRSRSVGVVVDGSIGLARAATDTGLVVACELRLVLAEETQVRRLESRATSAPRADDRIDIAERRLALARRTTAPPVRWPTMEVVAEGARHEVLSRALLAWTTAEAIARRRQTDVVQLDGATLDLASAGPTRVPVRWRALVPAGGVGPPTVVLVKPGLGPAGPPVQRVRAVLETQGYACVAAAAWPVAAEPTAMLVLAHHGLHLIHARWGSRPSRLPPGHRPIPASSRPPRRATPRGGRRYACVVVARPGPRRRGSTTTHPGRSTLTSPGSSAAGGLILAVWWWRWGWWPTTGHRR